MVYIMVVVMVYKELGLEIHLGYRIRNIIRIGIYITTRFTISIRVKI